MQRSLSHPNDKRTPSTSGKNKHLFCSMNLVSFGVGKGSHYVFLPNHG